MSYAFTWCCIFYVFVLRACVVLLIVLVNGLHINPQLQRAPLSPLNAISATS